MVVSEDNTVTASAAVHLSLCTVQSNLLTAYLNKQCINVTGVGFFLDMLIAVEEVTFSHIRRSDVRAVP